jgi:hypothetical protein
VAAWLNGQFTEESGLQVPRGNIKLNGTALGVGDGAVVSDKCRPKITATSPAEVMLFELP